MNQVDKSLQVLEELINDLRKGDTMLRLHYVEKSLDYSMQTCKFEYILSFVQRHIPHGFTFLSALRP